MLLKITFIFFILLFSSCGSLRVFEEKVPDPIKKNIKHIDEEKKGAYYLAMHTKDFNRMVADALSRSLGNPSSIEEDPNQLANNLFSYSSDYGARFLSLNNQLEHLQGKDISGTGFNLAPFISGFGIVGILALFILFPSLATILFFILKRTRNAMANVVSGIKEFSESSPDKAKDLNDLLDKKLDRVEKKMKWRFEAE